MHRMMQSSGTSEGLRGLIDTSLIKSIKKIIDNRGLFGPTVLPLGSHSLSLDMFHMLTPLLAINIMATFVHNEPTSLSIIQETGLPESFFKAIETGIEPSIEVLSFPLYYLSLLRSNQVLQSIPNALGALCLNETGQSQLSNRPSIIPAIFTIFTSERHLKVLIDKENAVIIGTAIDELVRHHPLLKAAVFASLKSTLGAIEEIGRNYQVPSELLHWYQLAPAVTTTVDMDVKMEDSESIQPRAAEVEAVDVGDEAASKPHDNTVVSFVDVLCRVCYLPISHHFICCSPDSAVS